MTTQYIIGGLLLVLAIALVWLIGAQQSKRKSGLSGSIAGNGASETYLSRNKIASRESSYKKITLIVAIIFAILVLTLYIVGSVDPKEDTTATDATMNENLGTTETSTTETSTTESSATESSAVESADDSSAESAEDVSTESSVESSEAVESSESNVEAD